MDLTPFEFSAVLCYSVLETLDPRSIWRRGVHSENMWVPIYYEYLQLRVDNFNCKLYTFKNFQKYIDKTELEEHERRCVI